jgi:hypothetical protein
MGVVDRSVRPVTATGLRAWFDRQANACAGRSGETNAIAAMVVLAIIADVVKSVLVTLYRASQQQGP